MAGLLVAVFGALFTSADAVFSDVVPRLVPKIDIAVIFARSLSAVAAVVAAATAALLALRPPVAVGTAPSKHPRSRVEWVLPLAALNMLFGVFVTVQLAVLFGGHDHVLRTAGLTYAEYARQGFWQLLVASVLTLAVVAVAVRLVSIERRADRVGLRSLLGLLCVLTLVVLASAIRRLGLYEEAYGLTRLRVAVHAVLYWLLAVFVLVLSAGAVRRARWLPRATVSATGIALMVFSMSNPDARIAASAVSRAEHEQRIDVGYLSTLSADAVPTLLRLPDDAVRGCTLAAIHARLVSAAGWRNWNLARTTARRSLAMDPPPKRIGCGVPLR